MPEAPVILYLFTGVEKVEFADRKTLGLEKSKSRFMTIWRPSDIGEGVMLAGGTSGFLRTWKP